MTFLSTDPLAGAFKIVGITNRWLTAEQIEEWLCVKPEDLVIRDEGAPSAYIESRFEDGKWSGFVKDPDKLKKWVWRRLSKGERHARAAEARLRGMGDE